MAQTKVTHNIENTQIALDAAEIPNLDATKITTGDIAAARLNSINGENVKAILSNSRVSRPVIDEAYNRYNDRYLCCR